MRESRAVARSSLVTRGNRSSSFQVNLFHSFFFKFAEEKNWSVIASHQNFTPLRFSGCFHVVFMHFPVSSAARLGPSAAKVIPRAPPIVLPSPMRGTFVDRNPHRWSSITVGNNRRTFYNAATSTDLCMRPSCDGVYSFSAAARLRTDDPEEAKRKRWLPKPILQDARPASDQSGVGPQDLARPSLSSSAAAVPRSFGDRVDHLWMRWRKKRFGFVSWGPNNFPHNVSRWLGMRHAMKKHRYLKRYKFQRMKLAAVSNLPFSKMIRVNLLPELKSAKAGSSSQTESVDVATSSQIVSSIKGGSGKRRRPKSKYTS